MTRKQQQTLIFSLITAVVALMAAAILLYITQIQAPQTDDSTFYSRLSQRTTRDGAAILGRAGAPVTLVVFTDFACPHCDSYTGILRDFVEAYVVPGEARLEMRILAGVDPEGSLLAARAALCAGQQNSFWRMQEALASLQPVYGRQAFTADRIRSISEELNLDLVDLQNCLDNPRQIDEALQRNAELANSVGLNSMPSVLIRGASNRLEWIQSDGVSLKGMLSLSTLGAAVEGTLSSAD